MMQTHTLGFPRIGIDRELKRTTEGYWRGDVSARDLEQTASDLRMRHWRLQHDAGVDLVPVGDFSLYDHMLDMVADLGAVPQRYGVPQGTVPGLDDYFRMARGQAGDSEGGSAVRAMEMTKWFDTNYHYIVPELWAGMRFSHSSARLASQAHEALSYGLRPKAVLPGPFTFLALAKCVEPDLDRWTLLDALTDAYAALLADLSGICSWIQLDEPVLATDCQDVPLERMPEVYARLRQACTPSRVLLATYFGPVDHHLDLLCPAFGPALAHGLHLDLVRGPDQLDAFLGRLPAEMSLSLGLVDGRNVWRVELDPALALAKKALAALGPDRLLLAPSCSLLHCPIDLDRETVLDARIRIWMAFARQKCGELHVLSMAAQGLNEKEALRRNRDAWAQRRSSLLAHDPAVAARLAAVTPEMSRRISPYAQRAEVQRERLQLPPLPTTTIGSYPQTPEIRAARLAFRQGGLTGEEYEEAMRGHIREVVARQEEIGLDVLVHGEPERNDMVEYFGQHLDGFCFTRNGWVQSYGTRCVKPPVIYGDVSRPGPITVPWTGYARTLTQKPVKGMLTGPVTILCWSFVRDDQPRSETCRQIALAIRDEVQDLEAEGHAVIQVDEPALREGLPLRRPDWRVYLDWAVECFRLTVSGVRDDTQVHTHMCYAEFNEIIEDIAALDADVISIEASRSDMALLEAFRRFDYPNEVGPGVWDIHSPRVPSVEEMAGLLRLALRAVPQERLWVNPDCGLKTRAWPETLASLKNMVEAARLVRSELS